MKRSSLPTKRSTRPPPTAIVPCVIAFPLSGRAKRLGLEQIGYAFLLVPFFFSVGAIVQAFPLALPLSSPLSPLTSLLPPSLCHRSPDRVTHFWASIITTMLKPLETTERSVPGGKGEGREGGREGKRTGPEGEDVSGSTRAA